VLFASRPDLSEAVTAPLRDLPLATAQAVLAAIPRGPGLPTLARAPLQGGNPQAGDLSHPEMSAKLDVDFGIADIEHSNEFNSDSLVQTFGVPRVKGTK
jgi:hypothetical protein